MSRVVVTGASDDLIEFDGDIVDEVMAYTPKIITFDEGTRIHVEYDHDGVWRISPAAGVGEADWVLVKAEPDADGEYLTVYTDTFTLTGDVTGFTVEDAPARAAIPDPVLVIDGAIVTGADE